MADGNLRIDSGVIRLIINDDPTRVIEFNPDDVLFVERFYSLIKVFQEQEEVFQKRIDEIKKTEEKDSAGVPESTPATIELVREVCNFLREQIDKVFGAGASDILFGEVQSLGMFEQFFVGITPFIEKSRSQKIAKYQRKKSGK